VLVAASRSSHAARRQLSASELLPQALAAETRFSSCSEERSAPLLAKTRWCARHGAMLVGGLSSKCLQLAHVLAFARGRGLTGLAEPGAGVARYRNPSRRPVTRRACAIMVAVWSGEDRRWCALDIALSHSLRDCRAFGLRHAGSPARCRGGAGPCEVGQPFRVINRVPCSGIAVCLICFVLRPTAGGVHVRRCAGPGAVSGRMDGAAFQRHAIAPGVYNSGGFPAGGSDDGIRHPVYVDLKNAVCGSRADSGDAASSRVQSSRRGGAPPPPLHGKDLATYPDTPRRSAFLRAPPRALRAPESSSPPTRCTRPGEPEDHAGRDETPALKVHPADLKRGGRLSSNDATFKPGDMNAPVGRDPLTPAPRQIRVSKVDFGRSARR